jgi:hypothetical protein
VNVITAAAAVRIRLVVRIMVSLLFERFGRGRDFSSPGGAVLLALCPLGV